MLSLIIDAPSVSLPSAVLEDQLFSHFQYKIIEFLQNGTEEINYFGYVPDNGANGIDELLIDGVLFRFYVLQSVLGIDVEAEPHLVRKAFLNVREKFKPSGNTVLEARSETKVETIFVLNIITYNLTAIKSAE